MKHTVKHRDELRVMHGACDQRLQMKFDLCSSMHCTNVLSEGTGVIPFFLTQKQAVHIPNSF